MLQVRSVFTQRRAGLGGRVCGAYL